MRIFHNKLQEIIIEFININYLEIENHHYRCFYLEDAHWNYSKIFRL